ncbi:hypothetical protein [Ornithinimicrobium kibberense]|uniref:hypothetical protein n=1 Tax=Ornithinimicrobium kibberense TaxID=282060 RepID=UPI00361E81D9
MVRGSGPRRNGGRSITSTSTRTAGRRPRPTSTARVSSSTRSRPPGCGPRR